MNNNTMSAVDHIVLLSMTESLYYDAYIHILGNHGENIVTHLTKHELCKC